MEDKRKNNGGHSTKAKGIDKRKNQFKDIFADALTKQDLINVIKKMHDKAINEQDVNAAKLILEYCLGKPQQSVDMTSGGESINIPTVNFTKSE